MAATITHQDGKGWKRSVGSYLNPEGKRLQRTFWLGHSKRSAEALARRIEVEWERLRLSNQLPADPTTGKAVWSPEQLAEIGGWIATAKLADLGISQGDAPQPQSQSGASQAPAPVIVPPKPSAPVPVVASVPPTPTADGGLMLFAAMELFIAEKSGEANLAKSWKRSISQRLDTVKLAFGRDVPLNAIGYDQLAAAMRYLKSHPVSEWTGKPLSAQTIISVVQVFKMFFDWLDRAGKWVGFRRWDECFELPRKRLLSGKARADEGDDQAGVKTFTASELATIWGVANERQRVYFGLGLLCGFTSIDCATLRKVHVKEIDGETYVEKMRNKTGVKGRWWLPPEVATLLKSEMAKSPAVAPDVAAKFWRDLGLPELVGCTDFALTTTDAFPVVHWADSKSDSVALTWARLVKLVKSFSGATDDAPAELLSYKFLRKTGASAVEEISGSEVVAQAFLAQVPESVAGKHYLSAEQRISRAEKAAREMYYKRFKAVFNSNRQLDRELKQWKQQRAKAASDQLKAARANRTFGKRAALQPA